MTRGAKIGCLAFAGAIVLLAILIVGSAIFIGRDIAEGARLSTSGRENIENRQYGQAVANLTAATKHILLGDTRYWVYVNRASAEKFQKHYDAAISDLNEAIRLKPDRVEPYQNRGLVFERMKDTPKALADFDRVISLNPNRGEAHFHRGTLLYNDGEIDKALADFEEACRIWPTSAQSLIMLGRCYLSQDELDRALASFEAALRLFPGSREARERRIDIYHRLGESERAFLDLTQLEFRSAAMRRKSPPARSTTPFGSLGDRLPVAPLPSAPAGPSSHASFALLFHQAIEAGDAHDFQRAIDLYNAILVLPIGAEQASLATSRRGICYLILGDAKRAEADFDEAIQLDPKSADAYAQRGFGLAQKSEFEDALKDFEEAIRLNPNFYVALCDRGQAFARIADYKSALADFDRAIELRPSEAKAFLDRADASLRQKDFAAASGDAMTVIGFQPNSVRAHIALIKAHAAEGKTDDAEQELATLRNLSVQDESEMRNAVAWFRATWPDDKLRSGAEAVTDARRACELTSWKAVAYIDTLAAAEAETGDFGDAVKHQEQALHLPVVPSSRLGMEERLKAYRQHQPFRDSLTD